MADELAELGCERVSLMGGEPFLRGDWEQIAARLKAGGVIVEMVSNGWFLDAAMALRVAEAGVHSVSISIDGTQEVHDFLRASQGSYQRALAAVGHVRSVGLPVGVLTQVNRVNLEDLDGLFEALVEAGADGWQLQLSEALGRFGDEAEWALMPEQLPELERRIVQYASSKRMWVYAADNIGYMSRNDPVMRQTPMGTSCWLGCQAGLRVLGIASDGAVRGCLSLPPEPYNEASVKQRGLRQIWEDPTLFRYNREFSESSLTGACGGCAFRRICRGGCTSLRHTSTGELGENPYCLFRVGGLKY